MYHEHPIRVLRYSLKNIWLLIFPLIRGITAFKFNPLGIYVWIKDVWMDILVLGVILIYGLIRWYCSVITVTDRALIHTEGFLVKIRRTIPLKNISAVTLERAFYLVPVKAMSVNCDTRAGIFRSTDLKLVVKYDVGTEIMKCLPDINEEHEIKDIPVPSLREVIAFSVFFSSGFSGAIYIAALFYKGGDLVQDLIGRSLDRITATTEHITSRVIHGIPKAGFAIAGFFIAAWLLSFLMNLMRYGRFRLSADKDHINISCGIAKRRDYRIKNSHINFTEQRQNLIMKLFGYITVNISCPGYGLRSHLPVLIPITRRKRMGDELRSIGIISPGEPQYKPKWTAVFGFAGLPAAGIVLVFLFYSRSETFPSWLSDIVLFIVIMSAIPLVWLTAVKTVSVSTTGITLHSRWIIIQNSKWFKFHTYVADRRNVVTVEIVQNVFQKIFGKCHVVIWLCGEGKTKCRVRSLYLADGLEIAERLRHDIVSENK